jgi:hypothetical protein
LKPEPERPFGEWTGGVWTDWFSYWFLRREAEMLMLDADFPNDPFAR